MKTCSDCAKEYDSGDDGSAEKISSYDEWIFLVNVSNEIELAIVKGLMDQGQIPIAARNKGIEPIVGIIPTEGIDIYVPQNRFNEAAQLLNTEVDEKIIEEEEVKTEGGT